MYIKKLKHWTVKCPDNWYSDLSMLSMKARGILYYISLVIPENYAGSLEKILIKSSKDGKTSVRNGIKELQKYGFLKLNK